MALSQVSLKMPVTAEAYEIIAYRLDAMKDELLSLHRRKRRFSRFRARQRCMHRMEMEISHKEELYLLRNSNLLDKAKHRERAEIFS